MRSVILGGFGYLPKHLKRHNNLYVSNGHKPILITNTIDKLITPTHNWKQGKEIAKQLQCEDKDTIIHSISGSFWLVFSMLSHMDPTWRNTKIKSIIFDSCPIKADIHAFGGWLGWYVEKKTGINSKYTKRIASQLFHPFFPPFSCTGIDQEWKDTHQDLMFDNCVIPKSTQCLFIHTPEDPVIDPDYLFRYIHFLQSRSTSLIQYKQFRNSSHAMSIKTHSEEYERTLNEFLRQ